mmetsp:Transcript_38655/g.152648  ORF Transcript_38655/g.152648 Transcript_38655/m.152648 type:complete len:255 (-) Transcript_38655:2146-2910(-)
MEGRGNGVGSRLNVERSYFFGLRGRGRGGGWGILAMGSSAMVFWLSALIAFGTILGISMRTVGLDLVESESVYKWSAERLPWFIQGNAKRTERRPNERRERAQRIKFDRNSEKDREVFTGYTILLVGYILFPALGIALVQRLHEQRIGNDDRGLADHGFQENIIYNPLPHTSFLQTRYWSGHLEIQREVGESSVLSTGGNSNEEEEESCIVCLGPMRENQKVGRTNNISVQARGYSYESARVLSLYPEDPPPLP